MNTTLHLPSVGPFSFFLSATRLQFFLLKKALFYFFSHVSVNNLFSLLPVVVVSVFLSSLRFPYRSHPFLNFPFHPKRKRKPVTSTKKKR